MKFLFILLTAGLICAGKGWAEETHESTRYNVLFIISDDMRGDLPLARMPNLDRLAATGVRFERAYCQYPLCCPARTSLLTGRKPTTTHVLGNRTWFGDLHPDYISLPRYFKDHGYVTAHSGKIFHDGIDDVDAWDEGGEPRFLAGAGSETNLTARLRRRATTVRGPAARSGQTNSTGAAESVADGAQSDGESRAAHSDRAVVIEGNGESDHDYLVTTKAMQLLGKYKTGRSS